MVNGLAIALAPELRRLFA